jgi:subfamily B ATP-binding cassette protein MsbA
MPSISKLFKAFQSKIFNPTMAGKVLKNAKLAWLEKLSPGTAWSGHTVPNEMIAFLRSLWRFARPYKSRLVLGLVCGIFYAMANAMLVLVIKLVVDLVFPGATQNATAQHIQRTPGFLRPLVEHVSHWMSAIQSPSSKTGIALVICTIPAVMLLRGVFGYLNVYLMNWAAIRTVADLRTRLFAHLQNLSLGFFSTARTGELISRITNDTQVLHTIIGTTVASMVKDPITLVCLLIVLLVQEPKLTLISIVVLPTCVLPMVIYGRKVRASARSLQAHAADLASLMHESFTGNRIIKAYNLEETVLTQFRETTRKYISHMMRVLRANEIPGQSMEVLGGVGVALVFLYVKVFAPKQPTAGDFFQFISAVFLMYQPIKSLTRINNQLEQARAASQRVFELLQIVSTIVDPPSPVPLKASGADIRFEQIEFAYGEKPVLQAIDLTARAGQLVALVGSSGSGKTTLTNLLLRFYDPQRGAVLIGGTDIRSVAIQDLRQQVALVAQETILFNDTVRHNIALGRPGASDAEIEAAARHAHAHDFIIAKPQGYDTLVGEKGIALSGGQRQRIAIARAILKDAPILVLDEATNALDAESERAVQAALEELMQGRTTICIAHRLSTIQKADLIVVLDGGRIVETGTHQELIQKRGTYCKLYELQFELLPA